MKIALVTETFLPEINGVARTMGMWATHLSALGCQVTVVHPGMANSQQRWAEREVPGMPIPGYPGLQLGLPSLWRLRRIFTEETIDAVYVATPGPLGYAAVKTARRMRLPVIAGFHTQFDQYADHYGLRLPRAAIWRYLIHLHNLANLTLVPTADLASELSSRGIRDVALLKRAVDLAAFSPDRRDIDLRRTLGFREEQPMLLHVGRLAPEKNVLLALEAARAARRSVPSARLVVVGNGPDYWSLRIACPEAIFVGEKTGDELARFYASADGFLFPSETDTFGNVVLESLASGVPVVAYRRAAAAQFVVDGQNGFLCDPGDNESFIRQTSALARCAMDAPDYRRNARLAVSGSSPLRVAQDLVSRFALLAPARELAA